MKFVSAALVYWLLFVSGRWTAHAAQHKGRHHKVVPDDEPDRQRAPVFDWDGASAAAAGGDEAPSRITEVTTTLGQTAFLHCRVRYLGDRRVLWMRQRDLHILTSALHTYTNDWRISAVHSSVRHPAPASPAVDVVKRPANGSATPADVWDEDDGVWSEWTLRIRSTEAKDAGLYECQVSTEPKISKIYRLHVVVSKASILGSTELFVKKGSDINLTCVTLADQGDEASDGGGKQRAADFQQSVPNGNRTPLHFAWLHNGQVLNYSARGGLSVTTDTIAGQSRLLLARADPRDSGNYTCVPGPGATPASVSVHVLNGEQPAAMQRDNSASAISAPWRCISSCWSTSVLAGAVFWHQIVNRLIDVT